MLNLVYRHVLRLHRWLALAFAVPLLVVIATGLVLSFEPLAQQARSDRPIRAVDVDNHLLRYDPDDSARSLAIRTYDNTLTLGGIGVGGSIAINLTTGEPALQRNTGWWDVFLVSRRMHETLLLDLGVLVTASTFAMLLIVVLGTVMGWPQFRHSVRGWHQCAAWITLPLLIVSPLTALAMTFGVTLMSPVSSTAAGGGRVSMRDAVRLIAAQHDIGGLTSIRQRGGRLVARVYVAGELRAFAVRSGDLQSLQRNWPRLIHEGNWGGAVGPSLNVLTSLALLLLLGTGLTLWLRRTRRRAAGMARASLFNHQAQPRTPGA